MSTQHKGPGDRRALFTLHPSRFTLFLLILFTALALPSASPAGSSAGRRRWDGSGASGRRDRAAAPPRRRPPRPRLRRGAHLLERGPQAAALGAVLRGAGTGLTHALLGGFDSGHGIPRLSDDRRSGTRRSRRARKHRDDPTQGQAARRFDLASPGLVLNLPPSPPNQERDLEAQLSEFILALPMLVFAMTAHEYAHAATALRQGDDTAYLLGRVTLNPIPHIDPWMSLAAAGAALVRIERAIHLRRRQAGAGESAEVPAVTCVATSWSPPPA